MSLCNYYRIKISRIIEDWLLAPLIEQLQTFSVEDNITDIIGNVNELHEKIETNDIAIENLRDIKENGK